MPGTIKFYTDEHVSRAVIRGLRKSGADVVTVPEAGLIGAPDMAHLQFAASNDRVIFTQDEDFLCLHAEGIVHAGIAFAAQGAPIGRILHGLLLLHALLLADEMRGRVEFL